MRGSTSDKAGDLGELYFEELCRKAGLHCAKPTRDRTGKDYLIEFPPEELDKFGSLDSRPTPIALNIQVKTFTGAKVGVYVKLLSLEWLAKDHRPSLVCALRLDEDDNVADAYFIHILDDNLEKTLKQLRELTNQPHRISKTRVHFGKTNMSQVDWNPSAVANYFSRLAPNGMSKYEIEKARQIDNLGEKQITFSARVSYKDTNALIDWALGQGTLDVDTGELTEERFGLKRILPPGTLCNGHLSVSPEPETCIIGLHAESGEQLCRFVGQIVVPMLPFSVPMRDMRALLRTDIFEATLHSGKIDFKIEVSSKSIKIRNMADGLLFLHHVHRSGTYRLMIGRFGMYLPIGLISGASNERLSDFYFETGRLAERALEIYKLTNKELESYASIASLWEDSSDINGVHNLFMSPIDCEDKYPFESPKGSIQPEKFDCIFIRPLRIGENWLGCAFRSRMLSEDHADEKIRWRAFDTRPIEVRELSKPEIESYGEFTKWVKDLVKAEAFYVIPLLSHT